jgi:EAL domain-containing protein (putative c-di-GMP-specific phosphodiesterase class I)/GGDEF domain-containing protein
MLHPVDLALREKALAQYTRLHNARDLRLFYNLDSRVLTSSQYRTGHTLAMLRNQNLPTDIFCFELSEKHDCSNETDLLAVLQTYRNQGFNIAMDDYGSGFSGLQLLYNSEPDYLKIDRFFIQNIGTDTKKQLFVTNIINTAHQMSSRVIAEGVETHEEFRICRNLGCDLVQGYFVDPPKQPLESLPAEYPHLYEMALTERRNRHAQDNQLIRNSLEPMEVISADADLKEALEHIRHQGEQGLHPVVNRQGEPVGVIRDGTVKDYLYSPFAKELLQNPAFGGSIKQLISPFPSVDIRTPIEEIIRIYANADRLEGVLIVDALKYAGFLSAKQLIAIINEKNLVAARDQNPLTQLPGNHMINEYVASALRDLDGGYCLAYFDFDNFKPFNDHFGFRKGDRLIMLFADLLRKNANESGAFIGHIGGDDFFLGARTLNFESIIASVRALIANFGRHAESFVAQDGMQLGGFQTRGRDGKWVKTPLPGVSAAALTFPCRREHVPSNERVIQYMSDIKCVAKKSPERLAVRSYEDLLGIAPASEAE